MNRIKKCTAVILIIGIMIGLCPGTSFAIEGKQKQFEENYKIIEEIIIWKKSSIDFTRDEDLFQDPFLQNAGHTSGDWYAISLGRLGYQDDYIAHRAVLEDQIIQRYKTEGKLDALKATEWHRIGLALLSLGGDPTDVGSEQDSNGIDLIADGSYNRGETISLGTQGINGWSWGLTLLDSMRYKIPKDAHATRETIIKEILCLQLSDGGFALQAGSSDPDITAMTIQALAPYYNSEEEYTYTNEYSKEEKTATVRQIVDEALERLAEMQLSDGDFESWGSSNVESTAQVMVALCSLGIDYRIDDRFIKDGNDVRDGLMKYQMPDGGFIHSLVYDEENPTSNPDESNSMASEQVLYAMAALCRFDLGMRSLYDFRPEMGQGTKDNIEEIMSSIEKLPNKLSKNNAGQVKSVYEKYLQIPIEERSYVYNYYKLSEAMDTLNIPNDSEYLAENMDLTTSGNGSITELSTQKPLDMEIIEFTQKDKEKAEEIDDSLGTRNYVDVTSLLYKLNHAENKEDFLDILPELEEKKTKIDRINEQVYALNQKIEDNLYPFSEIGIKDRDIVEEIVKEYQSLSDYDQGRIAHYEDVIKTKTQIDNLVLALKISITIGMIAIILLIIIRKRIRKRKIEKQRNMMMLLDEEDEEE